AAVRSGDERRYLAAVDPRAERYREAQREVFANLRRLPLTQWTYRVAGVRRAEEGGRSRLEAHVRLQYRLRGDDRAPVTATERLALTERDGRWYVSSELPHSDRQLWEQGEITVVRGENSMVLGVGRSRDVLEGLARDADRSVSAVDRVWQRKWPRRVVVEAPDSLRRMAQLLDADEDTYEGIAAVTTGEAGGASKAPADRIVINPRAYGLLSEEGRQVVVTHETVHVASRTRTGSSTPLWLSEGLADWIGYQGTERTPKEAAAELLGAVKKGEAPRELPSDRDFRFGNDPEALGRAYESGWLACRLIADEWGDEKLMSFYERVGESGGTDTKSVLARALRDELGLSLPEFTQRWRSYVRDELS
uniref:hypothetical protein n=1 Tax=Streptomyces albidus (ex Kaewkla and Franco 2022) TaxID=722709 RepID=UPI0015EF0D1C